MEEERTVEGEHRGAGGGRSRSVAEVHRCAVQGDLPALLQYLEHGGDVEQKSHCGRTPLQYASYYGHISIARALLLAGADPNSTGGGNSSSLHFAAYANCTRVVQLLVEYGADPTCTDATGHLPEYYATEEATKAALRAHRHLAERRKSVMELADSSKQESVPLRSLWSPLLVGGSALLIGAAITVFGGETRYGVTGAVVGATIAFLVLERHQKSKEQEKKGALAEQLSGLESLRPPAISIGGMKERDMEIVRLRRRLSEQQEVLRQAASFSPDGAHTPTREHSPPPVPTSSPSTMERYRQQGLQPAQ
jgi:hypothetical protein